MLLGAGAWEAQGDFCRRLTSLKSCRGLNCRWAAANVLRRAPLVASGGGSDRNTRMAVQLLVMRDPRVCLDDRGVTIHKYRGTSRLIAEVCFRHALPLVGMAAPPDAVGASVDPSRPAGLLGS